MRSLLDRYLGNALAILMGVMVVNVLWQVFSRYILNNPSSFTDELARYLMIWLSLFGAAYLSGRNGHVAISFLPDKLSEKNLAKLNLAIGSLVILFALTAMVIGGSRLVYISYILGQKSPSLQIPLALVYLVVPISGIIIIYFKVCDLLNPKKINS